MTALPWLDAEDDFPPIDEALTEPNGLLAAGGSLSVTMLLRAYRQGIFPWYSDGQPILWWSPDPRCVISADQLHISRSLRKHQRKHAWTLSFDQQFDTVIAACSERSDDEGTWISDEMIEAYQALHAAGHAHSLEVWQGDALVGGLYGVAIGGCFFGESMFSRASNASKVAFWGLCWQLQRWNFSLIDCQVENPHLLSLGAYCIDRNQFQQRLQQGLRHAAPANWLFENELFSRV